jgi:TPR repeat protein
MVQRERSALCAAVGTSYLEGHGTDRDPKRGLASIERACDLEREDRIAAARPTTASCVELGRVLLLGVGGVARDEHRAVAVLRDECDRGMGKGCSYLGLVSELGLAGEPRDIAAAVKQYAPLCTYRDYFEGVVAGRPDPKLNVGNLIGEPLACYRLGVLSLQGRGVFKNPRVAAHLFASLCVDAELPELACAPAAALYIHYGFEHSYPPTDGSIQFTGPIGGDGRGLGRDPETWARQACAAGSVDGCRVLRQLYAYRDEHSIAFDFRDE